MEAKDRIDWSVETMPGVHSGDPVLRGTRLPVAAIVDNFDYGVSAVEIAEQFEVSVDLIEAILAYAKAHRIAHHL